MAQTAVTQGILIAVTVGFGVPWGQQSTFLADFLTWLSQVSWNAVWVAAGIAISTFFIVRAFSILRRQRTLEASIDATLADWGRQRAKLAASVDPAAES